MRGSVVAIAVGRPRTVEWDDGSITTSIFKTPVRGPVAARRHNLEGDRQADLRVHGGEYKAIYAYAAEDCAWWETELGRDLEPANFGENLTVRGLDPAAVCIGDVFRVGGAELEATTPRLPCFKLGIRFGDPGMVRRFARAARWGIYFRIRGEGAIEAGDSITRVLADPEALPVYEIARVRLFDREDVATGRRLAGHPRLDPTWRSYFRELAGEAAG